MRKAAIWITAISLIVLVITLVVMGIGVYEMDETIIGTTAYLALPCIIFLFGGLICLRWGSAKCPHCGKILLQTENIALTAVKKSNRFG